MRLEARLLRPGDQVVVGKEAYDVKALREDVNGDVVVIFKEGRPLRVHPNERLELTPFWRPRRRPKNR